MRRALELLALIGLVAVCSLLVPFLAREGSGEGSGDAIEVRDSAEFAAELFESFGRTGESSVPAFPFQLSIDVRKANEGSVHYGAVSIGRMCLFFSGRSRETVSPASRGRFISMEPRTG